MYKNIKGFFLPNKLVRKRLNKLVYRSVFIYGSYGICARVVEVYKNGVLINSYTEK